MKMYQIHRVFSVERFSSVNLKDQYRRQQWPDPKFPLHRLKNTIKNNLAYYNGCHGKYSNKTTTKLKGKGIAAFSKEIVMGYVLKLSKEINFSLRRLNNVFGLVTSLRDMRSGVWFPADERDFFSLQIAYNIVVSTWSPVQGAPKVDSRWEKWQAHDVDYLQPCLHDVHENNFPFTCIEPACSLLYCKFHVHFINPQNVYYTLINMFTTRNCVYNSPCCFLWCLLKKMNRKIIFVSEAADQYV